MNYLFGMVSGFIMCFAIMINWIKSIKHKSKSDLEMRNYNIKHWELIAQAARNSEKKIKRYD
jgi:hypothetical protein